MQIYSTLIYKRFISDPSTQTWHIFARDLSGQRYHCVVSPLRAYGRPLEIWTSSTQYTFCFYIHIYFDITTHIYLCNTIGSKAIKPTIARPFSARKSHINVHGTHWWGIISSTRLYCKKVKAVIYFFVRVQISKQYMHNGKLLMNEYSSLAVEIPPPCIPKNDSTTSMIMAVAACRYHMYMNYKNKPKFWPTLCCNAPANLLLIFVNCIPAEVIQIFAKQENTNLNLTNISLVFLIHTMEVFCNERGVLFYLLCALHCLIIIKWSDVFLQGLFLELPRHQN